MEKNKKALDLLKKGYKGTEVNKIVGININQYHNQGQEAGAGGLIMK